MNPRTKIRYKDFVNTFVGTLPVQEAVVLAMYYVENLTFPEIAHAMDISITEVKDLYWEGSNKCLGRLHLENLRNS